MVVSIVMVYVEYMVNMWLIYGTYIQLMMASNGDFRNIWNICGTYGGLMMVNDD